jgi:predicted dienelactone hydrolase
MKRMAKEMGSGNIKNMMDSTLKTMTVPDRAQRIANLKSFLQNTAEPLRSQSVAEWSADTRATIDVLTTMNSGAGDSPFKGRLDLSRIAVTGMSYGGATAGEFCYQDTRCKAAINIDGGQYGTLIDDSLSVPLLIISSDDVHAVHIPVLDLTRGPTYLARVPATTHIGLTDISLQGPVFRLLGMTGKLDPDRREEIMTGFMAAFLDKYLQGRTSAGFDSLPGRFPEVTVTSRNVGDPRP